MTPEGKKKAIIIGSLLVIGGVVGYLLYKKRKDKSVSGSNDTGTATDTSTDTKITTNAPVIKSTGGSGMPTDQVQAFQDWMDKNHPNWVNGKNLNKGSGYGTFGPSTSKAWASYGAEYTKKSSTPVSAPAPKPTASTDKKVYSKGVGSPIYTNVSDTIPYRLAGSGEYVGTTDGTIVKSYWGTPFYKLKWDKNKFVYIEVRNASFTA